MKRSRFLSLLPGILIFKNYGATTESRPYKALEIIENYRKFKARRGGSPCPPSFNFFLKKNKMRIAGLILGFILFLPFCSRLSYDIVPHKTALYHSLGLKVNVKNKDSGQRDNFKILLKYDDSRDKMLFLSPLNQVYGLLLLESEQALLIAAKKKKYWKGTFHDLVQEIWGLDFDYREFKRLVADGVLPEDKIKEQGLNISFEEGVPGEAPQRLKIEKGALLIKIKISDRKTGKGIISFSQGLKGMKEAGIRELLEAEEG